MRIGALKLKAQVMCGNEIAMGPGKADLLEAIDRAGSISAAGRELGMSYRRSWMLVDAMNRCFRAPLVETRRGGGKDSGARLTDVGREALAVYRALEADMAVAVGEKLAAFNALLASQPTADAPNEKNRQ